PGMILRAGERLNLDLGRSWIVGDRATDLMAGRTAGLAGGLHVLTGHGQENRNEAQNLATERFQVRLAETIGSAMDIVPLLKTAD
ncbi:MAG: HAD hydrolase-like protein, partial [Alphaproteobacteria bacterium]